jgi:nitrite reductase/ring-hydroxylating ferredoxin subunit
MQPFNTTPTDGTSAAESTRSFTLGEASHLPPGTFARFELPDGDELAVYNVNGEYYATENFCPHKGALLSEGRLCGHIVECGWHGWQFDVRTGECLTVNEPIKTYRVADEQGVLVVELGEGK